MQREVRTDLYDGVDVGPPRQTTVTSRSRQTMRPGDGAADENWIAKRLCEFHEHEVLRDLSASIRSAGGRATLFRWAACPSP